MKIITSRNGVALVAVLTVLLVLTLLLPVMFRTSEDATYSAATELNRQRASYLARSGVEMTVAAVKGTRDSEELSYKNLYAALKNKDTSHSAVKTKTSTIDGVDVTLAYTEIDPIWMFVNEGNETVYVCAAEDSEKYLEYANNSKLSLLGKTETTITYNGEPQFYEVDSNNNRIPRSQENAFDENGEIKENHVAIYNDCFIVESKSTVKDQKATRKAVIVRNLDTSNVDGEAIVAYTTRSSATAPKFLNQIEGLDENGKNSDGNYVEYGYGGNHAFANPFKANSKKEVNAVLDYYGATSGDKKYIYVFSTIGNMIIDADRDIAENNKDIVALGAFPGVRYRDHVYASEADKFDALNYISYADSVQRYNFMSFTATNVAQVKVPIDLRVNPARTGRIGDMEWDFGSLIGSGGELYKDRNASLFKMINIQAKDIAFEQRIDLMMSLYEAKGNADVTDKNAYRGGFLLLSAPASTPYSYYHEQLKELVPAGMVYFSEPVYLWLIENGNNGFSSANIGGSDAIIGNAGETMYRIKPVTKQTKFTNDEYKVAERPDLLHRYYPDAVDVKVYKLVDAGDVYYFNANKTVKENGKTEELPSGFNLVNWFLETKYLKINEYEGQGWWQHFIHLREVLYKDYMLQQIQGKTEGVSYYEDDFHYIGNMNEQHTLISPNVVDDDYVIWSS